MREIKCAGCDKTMEIDIVKRGNKLLMSVPVFWSIQWTQRRIPHQMEVWLQCGDCSKRTRGKVLKVD